MWCETHARAVPATQNVLLSSAPQASSGRPARERQAPARHVPARAAQHQRPPADHARTTESSVRVRIGRSCSSRPGRRSPPAARPRPRPRTRSARRRRCRWSSPAARPCPPAAGGAAACRGASRPSSRERGATASATAAPRRRGASTIGRSRESSSRSSSAPSSTSSAAAATSGTISANGLSSRCLRARSAATARSSRRHARQVEPAEPLDRHHPAAAQGTRASTGSDPRRVVAGERAGVGASASVGPQSGQAIGWAWKRRSAGSSYSARQAAHLGSRPSSCSAGRTGRRARS